MSRILMVWVLSIMVSGCGPKTVNVNYLPSGGSKSGGTVELSYYYLVNQEIPRVNEFQGLREAKERCSMWGYTDAEPFPQPNVQCTSVGGTYCSQYKVTRTYQCL